MTTYADPLQMSATQQLRKTMVGRGVPAIIVDDFLENPHEARRHALALDYRPASTAYPGKIAVCGHEDTRAIGAHLLEIVNTHYLSSVQVVVGGRRLEHVDDVTIDFAIVDTPPGDLAGLQRLPHVDQAPLFALLYLNPQPQGGTLFFERDHAVEPVSPSGYCHENVEGYRCVGKIEGLFNRLAIYPGFCLHSGEIDGDRLMDNLLKGLPRVTMRAIFESNGDVVK